MLRLQHYPLEEVVAVAEFFYFWKVIHGELFAPLFTWWSQSVLYDDGLRDLHPLGWCALGIYDRLLMFTEARKGLSMRVHRWISGVMAYRLE